MSVHDSILYLCKEEDADKVAALFQCAHLHAWSWLRYNMGVCEMPMSNAWLSSVEVDKVFRKSATTSTVTVSQPTEAPEGRAHNIASLIPVLDSLADRVLQ